MRRVIAAGPLSLIHQREVRGVLREVFRVGDGHVLKRYTYAGPQPRLRHPWVVEYSALTRLGGRGAPSVVGYATERDGDSFRGMLLRRFLPGDPVGAIDRGLADEIARLLAGFHGAGVTTEDAHRHNFLRLKDGDLAFMDFGRARVFGTWNPLLPAGIAFDLHRFGRACLNGDQATWGSFLDEYFRHCPFPATRRTWIRRLLDLEIRRYRMIKGGRPPAS